MDAIELSNVEPPVQEDDIFPVELDEQIDPAEELTFDLAAPGIGDPGQLIAAPPKQPPREETFDEEAERVAVTGPPLPLVLEQAVTQYLKN